MSVSIVDEVAKAFTRVEGGVGAYLSGDEKRRSRPMKLELSSEGRYALRALVYLAREADSGGGGRLPSGPSARGANPARRRRGRGGAVRDHALHHATAPLRRRPPLRPAQGVDRRPEYYPHPPRHPNARQLLFPGSSFPPLAEPSSNP